MSKIMNDKLRKKYIDIIAQILRENGEEVLVTGNNELTIPVVDEAGDDQYVCFTVKVPTGSRDGDAYDGYAMAEDYQLKQTEKAAKAAKAAEAKAKKIARDQKMREERAKAKAEHTTKQPE